MKKIGLFLVSFILVVFMSLGSGKAASGVAYFVVTNPGADMSTEININWHSDVLDTYVLITKASDTNYANATQVEGVYDMWSMPENDGTYLHSGFTQRFVAYANIKNLTPDTKYMYKVGKGSTFSDSYYFTTAAGDNSGFSFISIADPQYDSAAGANVFNNITNQAYAVDPNIKFSVLSGDVVDRGGKIQQWEMLFNLSSLKTNPIAVTPGNHEYYDASPTPKTFTSEYFNHFFKNPANGANETPNTSYFFKYNNVLFISLDSEKSTAVKSQQEWFGKVIEENFAQYIVVFMHRSFYGNIYGNVSPGLQANWQPLFDRYGVDLVLTGHDHVYTRSYKVFQGEVVDDSSDVGTYYVTMGPGGKKFYDAKDTYEAFFAKVIAKTTMANIIRVDSTGLHMNIINEAGASVDMFTIKSKRSGNGNSSATKEAIMDSFTLVPGVDNLSIASLRFSSGFYGLVSTVKLKNSIGQKALDKYLYNENMNNVDVMNVPLNVESTYELTVGFRDGTEMTKDISIYNVPYFGEISKERIIKTGEDSFAVGWSAFLENNVLNNYKVFVNGDLKGTATRDATRIDVTGVSSAIKNEVQLVGYTEAGVVLFTKDLTFGEDPANVVISCDPSEAIISEEEEVTITLSVEPNINAIYEIIDLNSNLEIVSHVKNVFVIKANLQGNYIITFKVKDKEGSASVNLTVNEKEVALETITILGNTEMILSETQVLIVSFTPENATNTNFTFESSNEAILKIDQTGKITPQAVGSATITVSNGDVSKTMVINVTNPVIAVTSIEVEGKDKMVVGNSQTLKVTFLPANATNANFTYSSSDEDILTVNASGKVTAVKAGFALIAITNGEQTKEFKITVTLPEVVEQKITSISISGKEEMDVNSLQTLTVTYEPTEATNADFTYLTSDETILTVDENGKVKALKSGLAVITVTNGEISSTFSITVLKTAKKGCGSTNAMMLLPLLGVALLIIRKRRFI